MLDRHKETMMPTYGKYLKIDELLGLQAVGEEHDEMLFIIIHQSYELWFKQVLHEMGYLQELLSKQDLVRGGHTMKRVLTILKMLVAKVDILETMTPLEFLGFRERLESGSGFQSLQFRELEFALGHKRKGPLEQFSSNPQEHARLEKRFHTPTLWDAFASYLVTQGYGVPTAVLKRDVTEPITPNAEMQHLLIDIYRNDPPIASFCERLVDLDEGIQEWRYRHVKMVERTIGTKTGTGGSPGAEYLRTTLLRPVFPDLWVIRSEF